MKCFYHSADLDGKCSAAIVRRKYPNCELIGINYGQPFPWDDIGEGETVFMVDFSLQPFEDMIQLESMCKLLWIDHHKSAINEAHAAGFLAYEQTLEDGTGACILTWLHLFPDDAVPYAVQLLGEYDVWDHHDPDCLPFQYGMGAEDGSPDSGIWSALLSTDHKTSECAVEEVASTGRIILDYQAKQNAGHAKTLCFDSELDGLKLLAANAGPINSKFFDSRWDADKYDAMCLFQWRPKGNSWTVSLYSDRDDVDVSEVCKARGGGGHKGAAGFQCAELPFGLCARLAEPTSKGDES